MRRHCGVVTPYHNNDIGECRTLTLMIRIYDQATRVYQSYHYPCLLSLDTEQAFYSTISNVFDIPRNHLT